MNYNVLILTTSRAPYRVELFNELGKLTKLEVIYEDIPDSTRNNKWYLINDYNYISYSLDKSIFYNSWKFIYKKLSDGKFDIVIFYEYSTKLSLFALFLCKLLKIPYIINCDGYVYLNKNKIINRLKKFLISNASGLLAGGYKAKEYFKFYGGKDEKIFKINFTSIFKKDILKKKISKSIQKEIKQRYGLPLNGKIVVTVGRFIELKNIEMLIDIWSEMPKNLNLVIIGEGKLENKYREKIRLKNLENVYILGFKSKRELFEIYRASDLLVHPSLFDVWGLVINEAMANGLPIIASNKTVAANELIENGVNGFIIDPYDSKEFENRIVEILDNESFRDKAFLLNTKKIKNFTYEESAKLIFRAIKLSLNK